MSRPDDPPETPGAKASPDEAELDHAGSPEEKTGAINTNAVRWWGGPDMILARWGESLVLAATVAWVGHPIAEDMVVSPAQPAAANRVASVPLVDPNEVNEIDLAAPAVPEASSWIIVLLALLAGTLALALAGWLLLVRKPVLAVFVSRRQNGNRPALGAYPAR